MRLLLRVLPYAGLVTLTVVVLLAALSDGPEPAPFEAPPELRRLAAPDLGLGALPLAGVVVDAGGRAVPDAGLVLLAAGRLRTAWSDREGRFALDELPEGPLDVAVTAQGFEPARATVSAGPAEVRVVLPRRIDPPPALPGLAALDLVGHVTFTPLETPADGYELAFLPVGALDRVDAGAPRRVRVAADGTYRVGALAPGEYEVLLLPPDARGGRWPNLLTRADQSAPRHEQPAPPDPAPAAGTLEPVQLDLYSRAGTLAGRLADRRRARGAAWLANALVRVEPLDQAGEADPVRVLWAMTDAEGAWSVRHLPPGRYRVSLAAGDVRSEVDVILGEQQRLRPELFLP